MSFSATAKMQQRKVIAPFNPHLFMGNAVIFVLCKTY